MNTKSKGNNFERDCSRMLSLWWTSGRRDDAIWRSASSGALTTVGKGRYLAHTGDFAATDGDAELLFKHVIIEAKRGYNRYSVQDLVDVPKDKQNLVHEMLSKLILACKTQGKLGMLIWKRDRRAPILICTDYSAYPGDREPDLVIPNFLGYRLVVLSWQDFSLDTSGPLFRARLEKHDAERQVPSVCGAQIKSLLMTPASSSVSTLSTSS